MINLKPKPLILVFPVTYKCNCKCVMCSIWMKQERIKDIPYEAIEKLFTSPVLASLEEIQITGGEPVLREDLIKIIKLLLDNCSKLKRLSLASNGMLVDQLVLITEEILRLLPHHAELYISLSLDGIGNTHNLIRGNNKAFENVIFSARALKERFKDRPNFKLGFNTVLSSFNYQQAQEILGFCQKEGLSVGFTLANTVSVYIESSKCNSGFVLTQEQIQYVRNFFMKLNQQWPTAYFEMMVDMLGGARRTAGCYARTRGMLIDVDGSVYPCGQSADLRCGNIYEEDISRIWNRKMNKKMRAAFKLECSRCTTNCYPTRASGLKITKLLGNFFSP